MTALSRCGEIDGCPVYTLRLESPRLQVELLSFGAVIQRLCVRDGSGNFRDVVLGFDHWRDYVDQAYYLGCTIGRVCNRISGARYTLAADSCMLDANEGVNHLHGGRMGFWNRPWQLQAVGEGFAEFFLHSPDGDMGYAGALDCTLRFSLSHSALTASYRVYAHGDTPESLTNHSYFNLNGQGSGDCSGHRVQIFADSFCEIDESCASTGRILPVAGTAMDLRQERMLAEGLGQADEQLRLGSGYNHNFVLRQPGGLRPVARVRGESSGICLELRTDRPGLHFYTGNYLDGAVRGKGGILYPRYGGLCLETQHFPDALNFSHFPSPLLKAGESSQSTTVYDFSEADRQ